MELHYWRGRKNVALSRHQRETLIFIIIIYYYYFSIHQYAHSSFMDNKSDS